MALHIIKIKEAIPDRPYYAKKLIRIDDAGNWFAGVGSHNPRVIIQGKGIITENPKDNIVKIKTELTNEEYLSGFHFYSVHTDNTDILGWWSCWWTWQAKPIEDYTAISLCEIPVYTPMLIGSERLGFKGLEVIVAQVFKVKLIFPCKRLPNGV